VEGDVPQLGGSEPSENPVDGGEAGTVVALVRRLRGAFLRSC